MKTFNVTLRVDVHITIPVWAERRNVASAAAKAKLAGPDYKNLICSWVGDDAADVPTYSVSNPHCVKITEGKRYADQ